MTALSLLPVVLLLLSPGSDALAQFRRWKRSPVPDVRVQAVRILRDQMGDEVRAALVSMLEDESPRVVAATRRVIAARPKQEGAALADAIAALRREEARAAGLRTLIRRGDDVARFLFDRSPALRIRATALGTWADSHWPAVLRDRETRPWALDRLRDPALASEAAESRDSRLRIAAARCTDDPRLLAALLRDASWRVRLAAMHAAEGMRHRDLVPPLIEGLSRPRGRVHARCLRTLESLTGASFGADVARWQRWWSTVGPGFRVAPPRKRRHGGSVSTLSFRRIPVESRRLIFVLDASRSMVDPVRPGKRRWDLVVEDLLAVLRGLPADARFNVVLFRTRVEAWKPHLTRATKGHVRNCAKWIEKQAPSGWTNLFDALELALRDDEADAIYLLTDGVPSRGAEIRRRAILEEIAFLNRFRIVQINCVQAGSSEGLGPQWRGFLRDLADAHDGVSVRE
ncbi:MAG: VWA domain-containing protein [Planctomycetota bacterium]|jgi:hypothetical protein